MLEAGQTLGRYRVEAQLGAGGMGEVYRAWDSTLRRWVALKVVAQGDGSGRAERLLGEARAAAGLKHPNIISIFDVGEDGGFAFVSMDLVEGHPLRDYVGDGSVRQEKQLTWLMQIASALRAAHKAGLVHRDIKPDNVMVASDGDVRVLDFGLAKAFSVDVEAPTAAQDALGPTSSFLTGQGRVIGTPAYMAPEQLAGGPASPLWDQYAWGVLACELLTGKHPRIAGLISVSGWVKAESLAHVPDVIAQVVARAMAPSPDQRFPSMDAVIGALGGPLSGSGASAMPAAITNPPPKPSVPSAAMNVQIGDTMPVPVHPNAPVQRRSFRSLGWLLVAVSAAGIAGSLVYWRMHEPPRPIESTPVATSTPIAPAVAIASSAPPPAASSAPVASASTPPIATTPAVVVANAPPKRKLSVRLRAQQSLQYDQRTVERVVNPMRPMIQACIEQHPPRTIPAAIGVDLELWNMGDELGKVRDARLTEPPSLSNCVRDVFMPLAFGPPKRSDIPPSAVFVVIDVE